MRIGKKIWLIPDGYYPIDGVTEPYVSHETICIINTGSVDAKINIVLYFEDQEPKEGFHSVCSARRSNHIRLDKLRNDDGSGIPRLVPYSILVKSDQPVICQYSKCDTTQVQMSLMTTMAYPCD